jgi:O-antigen/teichoic acid export membrane protein
VPFGAPEVPGRPFGDGRRVRGAVGCGGEIGRPPVSVRRNMASLLLSQLLTWMVSFVLLVEAPDRLGDDAWGAMSYATAFVGFFTLVVGLGSSTLLTREIARDRSLMSQWVYNAVLLKAAMVVGAPMIGIPLAVALGQRGDTLWLIIIGFGGMAFGSFLEIGGGALAGVEVMAKPAFYQVIQVYLSNGLGVLSLVLGYGVIVYGAVFTVPIVVPTLLTWLLLRRYISGPYHSDRAVRRTMVRAGIPLMALTVFNMIYGTIDIPILGFITDNVQVGWYSLAYKWVGIPIFVATAVVSAYFPRFSAHGNPISEDFPRLVNEALRLVLLASVPAAIGLALVSDELISGLYEPQYQPAIVLMQILAGHVPLAAMDTVLAVALIASNRQSRYLYVSIVAAVTNPIACVLLIHWANDRYANGAIGAAVVTVITELIVMSGAIWLRAPGVLDRATMVKGLRIAAAGLLMVPVLLLGDPLLLPVQVLLGGATYGLGVLLFGAVSKREIRSVVNSVTSKRRATNRPID